MLARVSSQLRDLHRRRVFRAAALYLVAAWVVIEVSTTVFPLLGLPAWTERLVLALLGVGFPVAIAIAWAFDLGPGGLARTPPADAAPAPAQPRFSPPANSIAVLPFVDLSRERDQEYLADGIADEILSVLARSPGLRVAARTSAFAFKGRNADVREIGRQLGVATVLEGSVRAAGDQLRVTAQLIDVCDGYQRWSRRFDSPLADVFAVEDEIAGAIAGALDVAPPELSPATRPVTPSTEAYEYYLRGRQYFHRKTLRSWRFAEQMFRRALQTDPKYVPAHAGHADTCAFLYMFYDASEEMRRCADDSSLRALEYGPDCSEAHVSRGLALSLTRRYAEANAEFERALELSPQSYDASYFLGRSLWAEGDMARAEAAFRRATEIQPESYDAWGLLSTVLAGQGRVEEAKLAQQRTAEATERVLAVSPDDVRALYFRADSLLQLGEREHALELAERALGTDPDDAGVRYNLACFYAQAGKEDVALEQLEHAVELGFAHRDWLEHDSDLANLRDHPRFRAVLARLSERAS